LELSYRLCDASQGAEGEAMADKKEKTISYRRAIWVEGKTGITLERCLKDALKNLKTIEERTVSQQGQEKKIISSREPSNGGVLLHITADTPGEYASVVPKAAPGVAELDLDVAEPPGEGEWLDGDAFLFVRNDHMCVCTTGLRDAAITNFVHAFFQKADIRKDSDKFDLQKVADVSKLKMLHKQGVREIVLKATMFQATADYEKRKAQPFSIVSAAARQFKALIKKTNDYTRDGLQVYLSIRSDHRFKKDFKLGEKRIEDVAADIVRNAEHDDDFEIITKSGQKIGPREIFVRAKVLIDGEGKTVDRDKAWRELTNFHKRLLDTGVLEQ
jgi:hypothetical protein